jgi:hypothetical protein
VNADDIPLHDILDAGIDIGKKNWGLKTEFVKSEIDALVGVSAPRCYGALHSGCALELRISNSRADRVHIRVAMTYDESFHFLKNQLLTPGWQGRVSWLSGS